MSSNQLLLLIRLMKLPHTVGMTPARDLGRIRQFCWAGLQLSQGLLDLAQ
jgi:hypothetical protein